MKSTLLRICPILIVGLIAPSFVHAAAYLKFDGIDGEATDHHHKDWIIIESMSHSLSRDSSDPTAPPFFGDFEIRKRIDKSSPLLAKACAEGNDLMDCEIEFTRTAGDEEVTYYRYKLTRARVTSFDVDSDGDSIPTDDLSLSYRDIMTEYRELGPDGLETSRAMAYWDLDTNEGGSSSSPEIEQLGNVEISSGEERSIDLFISDPDTPVLELTVEATSSNPDLLPHPTARKRPTGWGLDITAGPTDEGQVTVQVTVSDGDYDRSMSFSVFIDSTGTPWGGFIDAYFTEEEQLDADLVSPIEDPDRDNLPTLLEFVFGSNPREYSPASEQLKASPRHIAPPDGIGEGDEVIDIQFQRRIDEPRIRLTLYGSPDGVEWTELKNESGVENPLYEEKANKGENPLFDEVEGTANPPDDPPAYIIRAIAEMI